MSKKSLASTFALMVGALLLPLSPACKKPAPAGSGTTAKDEPTAGQEAGGKPAVVIEGTPTSPAAAIEVGMLDPLPKLNTATAKSLQRGYKALNAKNWEECAAAFSEITAVLPDYLDARYYTARAMLNQAKVTESRLQLEELVKRNFVTYAGRAAASKDWLALRTSAEWPAYQQAEQRTKTAYTTGLTTGLVLVMRTGAAKPPKYEAVTNVGLATEGVREAKLDSKQEAFHFDPLTGRYRPLTHTDGKLLAAQRSPDGKTLIFVLAERAQHKAGKLWFVEPQLGFLDLTTLETAGPVPLKGNFASLSIGFSKDGTPTCAATAGAAAVAANGTFQLDSTHTGAVKIADDQGLFGERTEVWVDDLQHSERRLPADIKPAVELQSFTITDPGSETGKSVTSAVKLAGDSFAWTPNHKLLVYAGAFDACTALDKRKEVQKDKNGLFVYDVDKKAAQRLDAARTTYEAQWVSDDFLAFETGIDAESRVTLYNVKSGEKTLLQSRHGGGLYGVSAHKCEDLPPSAEAGSETALPPPPASAPDSRPMDVVQP